MFFNRFFRSFISSILFTLALVSTVDTANARSFNPCPSTISAGYDEAIQRAVGGSLATPAQEVLQFELPSAGLLWIERTDSLSTALELVPSTCWEDATSAATEQSKAFLIEQSPRGLIVGIDRAGPIYVRATTQHFELSLATAFLPAEATMEIVPIELLGRPLTARLTHLRSPSTDSRLGTYLAGHVTVLPEIGRRVEEKEVDPDPDSALTLPEVGKRVEEKEVDPDPDSALTLPEVGKRVEEREVDPDPDSILTLPETDRRVEEKEVDPDPDTFLGNPGRLPSSVEIAITPLGHRRFQGQIAWAGRPGLGTRVEEKEVDPDPDSILTLPEAGRRVEEKEVDPDPDGALTLPEVGKRVEEREVDPDPDSALTLPETDRRVEEREVDPDPDHLLGDPKNERRTLIFSWVTQRSEGFDRTTAGPEALLEWLLGLVASEVGAAAPTTPTGGVFQLHGYSADSSLDSDPVEADAVLH